MEFSLKELKEITFNGENILNWQYIDGIKWRIFYLPEKCLDGFCSKNCDKKHGFKFCALQWCGGDIDESMWNENTLTEIIYQGQAQWDGVRHLYMGDEQTDNYGYIYYPSLFSHMEILKEIKRLELTYCQIEELS